jgi:hypothetical protein
MKKQLFTLSAALIISGSVLQAQTCHEVCPAVGLSSQFEWIAGISIGPLFNISGNNGGYADFGTSIPATFAAGSSYGYTIAAGYGDGPFSETWKAWMDFNQDGDFEDPGEQIIDDFGQFQLSGSVSIPSNAYNGLTKLRVAMGFAVNNLCENVAEGEIEDYCVTVTGGIDPPDLCNSSMPVTGLASTIGASSITLSWDAVPNSVGCRVSGGLTGNFNINKNVIGFEANSLTVPLSALAPGEYNWRVVCGCSLTPPYDLTPNSATATFSIGSSAIGLAATGGATNFGLSLSPNPAVQDLNLSVNAGAEANQVITVTDLAGRTVMQKDTQVAEGLNTIRMDVSALSAGTYLILFGNGTEGMASAKFVKQ